MHIELTDSQNKHALLCSACFNCNIETLDAYSMSGTEKDWLDCKLEISYDWGPFQHFWVLILMAADKHKPKVALAAPGLLIYAAQSLLHSLRGLVQKWMRIQQQQQMFPEFKAEMTFSVVIGCLCYKLFLLFEKCKTRIL